MEASFGKRARLICAAIAAALMALSQTALVAEEADATATAADAAARRIDEELAAAWKLGSGPAGAAMPMDDLSFPIDHFDDGTVRAQFSAKWALIPEDEDDFVRAKGVVIELYDEAGDVIGFYMAENCIFDRATRVGYCEGAVRIEYRAPGRNIRLDGKEMQWDLVARDAKILSEPVLVMSEVMGELGGAFR